LIDTHRVTEKSLLVIMHMPVRFRAAGGPPDTLRDHRRRLNGRADPVKRFEWIFQPDPEPD